MSVVAFRPFKIPAVQETQFFQVSDETNQNFLKEDLARSGLVQSDLWATTTSMLPLKEGAQAGYMIPYFDLTGNPICDERGFLAMYRTRMKMPEYSREARYTQPSKEHLAKLELPPFVPYIHPLTLLLDGEELICAEGEKKTVAILKYLKLPAFGIGGCQLWRNPDGSGGIHPWIRQLLSRRNMRRVAIVPDGDIYRYDISTAYGNFARSLENEGVEVRILTPPGKIDDLLAEWKEDANVRFTSLPIIRSNDLVQSPSALIKQFGLAFKTDTKDRPTVYQHTSNIMKLMEEHNAFPRIWRNQDNNKIMVGEDPAQPDLTEIDIANYFQHNFGFDKVTHRTIFSCVQALGKRNARSPFLEYIRNQQWDGRPRLETWLQDFWGVGDSAYVREVGSKWLISACARMDKPGTKIDWMMIVVGPQKTGKTSMPSIMFKNSNLTLYGEHNDKDLHMLLHSALCVGFDELDSFNRKEASNLKAMVTRNEDSFRPPYGASIEVFPRRFTLYGCGNRHDFLQYDPTGYRRYAVIEVARLLDFGRLEGGRDQLWAEAWTLYSAGQCKYWEVDHASEQAERYVIPNLMEDRIEEFLARKQTDKLTPGKENPKTILFKMTELLLALGIEHEASNPHKTREISSILQKLNVIKPDKTTRHPDTGAVGRWYIYDPSTQPPL